jgi:AraC family transcriptional regulator
LTDGVAMDAPLLAALIGGMLSQLEAPQFSSRLVLDTLLQSVVVHLICQHSTMDAVTRSAPHSLAPRRLRRVLDFIEANLRDDLELDDLASIAGSSRFHFSRAFRDSTGFPPYRYLVHRRVEAARALLLNEELSIEEVAARCGFKSSTQFAVMFKQVFGTTPSRFRREH